MSLVDKYASVAASAQASSPPVVNCANVSAALVPKPVSTSNTRVYFMDAQGVVRFLAPSGDSGQATTVPAGTTSRRSMFAVSPDDQRIAVVVDDFTSSGASTRLYVEDLNGGGNHLELFSETGAFTLWPIGWHGTNNLVVAKVPSCTQGGGPFCCGPLELHVIDPATGNRRFTIGGATCVIVGPPSPGGATCEDNTYTQGRVLDWTGNTLESFPVQGPTPAFVSPDGQVVALVANSRTSFWGAPTFLNMQVCGWIDQTHVFSGEDSEHQPQVSEVNVAASALPVAAHGDRTGRIPGYL